MAKKNCEINKKATKAAVETQEERDEQVQNKLDSKFQPETELEEHLEENDDFNRGIIYGIDKIGKSFIKAYGTDGERVAAANIIYGILRNNPFLIDPVERYAKEHISRGHKAGELTYTHKTRKKMIWQTQYDKLSDSEKKSYTKSSPRLKLSYLPIGTLKNILKYVDDSTADSRVADFDGFMGRRITPRERAKRDPSHAFFMMEKATRDYATDISNNINKFVSENPLTSTKGMDGVYNKVTDLGFDIEGDENVEEKLIGMFNRFQHGWIFVNEQKTIIDKNGNKIANPEYGRFMIYTERKPKVIQKEIGGKMVKIYDTFEDGTLKYGWSNAVLLADYTPPNSKKGAWYVKLSKVKKQKFIKYREEARGIFKEVGEFVKKEMLKETTGLLEELSGAINGKLTYDELKLIFFRGKTEVVTAQGKVNLLDKLSLNEKTFINHMKTVFDFSVNDEIIIANGGKIDNDEVRLIDEHNNYFPVTYNRDRFPDILDLTIKKLDAQIEAIAGRLKEGKMPDGTPMAQWQKAELTKRYKSFVGQLNHAKMVKDKLKGMHIDAASQTDIPFGFAQDNKYFKSVSNAYDIRQMRVDSHVFYDYLKVQMSAIQRNKMAAQLVRAFRQSQAKNTLEMHNVVSNAMVNFYKVLFHTPDIEGPFSKGFLKGALGSVENLNNTLNKMRPGRNKSPEQTQRTLRIISGWLTGWYLGGVGTVIQNKLDKYRNIIDHGYIDYRKAVDLLKNTNRKEGINRIIRLSGITEFSDFFSQSMVNGIVGARLEQEVSMGIIKASIDYHYKITKGTDKRVAEKEFRATIQEYLNESTSIVKAEDIEIMSKKDAKESKYDLRQRIRMAKVNRLVEHAIRHEYVYHDMLKKGSWSKFFAYPKKLAGEAVRVYNDFLNSQGWTMDATEQYIRSISFIIGVERAVSSGLVNIDVPWYELNVDRKIMDINGTERDMTETERRKEEEDIQKIIDIGRDYSYFTNFALSTQGVGQNYWGGIGNLWGKFNYWSNQKMGRDSRIIKEAYIANKDIKDIQSDTFSYKAVGKTLKQVFTQRNARTTAPQVAALRNFLIIQGPTTLIWDIASVSIPAIGMVRALAFMSGVTRSTRGFTSDILSLMFIPLILGLKLGLGEDDDDERWDKTLKHYTRKLWFGFVPTWGFETVISLLSALSGENKRANEDLINQFRPFIGGSTALGDLTVGTVGLINELSE